MEYLARHNKVWQNVKTKKIFGDKLTLKSGEKITDYHQIPKTKEQPTLQPAKTKAKQAEKPFYFDNNDNDDKGVY